MQRQSRSMITITALTALLSATSARNIKAADECRTDQSQPVLPRGSSSISGHRTLVVNNEGADVVIRAENLTPGIAYTAWFLISTRRQNALCRSNVRLWTWLRRRAIPPACWGEWIAPSLGRMGD